MTRCHEINCNKKLKLSDIKCRCQNTYCSLHRLPENHKCSYNYKLKQHEIIKLESEMKCVSEKCIKI